MTDQYPAAAAPKTNWKKFAVQVVVGGIAGAGGMLLMLTLFDGPGGADLEGDTITAIGAGVVYLLMGLLVGLGAAFPKPGATMLNVEDEGEIREQKTLFGSSALGCILIGASALVLAAATPTIALFTPVTGAVLFTLCLAGSISAGVVSRRATDEFGQQMATESNATFLTLFALVFGLWAALAHLGLAPMFTGLAFYAGSLVLYLLAVFVVVGRRGLLAPKG